MHASAKTHAYSFLYAVLLWAFSERMRILMMSSKLYVVLPLLDDQKLFATLTIHIYVEHRNNTLFSFISLLGDFYSQYNIFSAFTFVLLLLFFLFLVSFLLLVVWACMCVCFIFGCGSCTVFMDSLSVSNIFWRCLFSLCCMGILLE